MSEILKGEWIRKFIDYLQSWHSLNILLALAKLEGELGESTFPKPTKSWELVRGWLETQGVPCSDSTYRARCKELVELGLAKAIRYEPRKWVYKLTRKGEKIAKLIGEMLVKTSQIGEKG